MPTRLLKKPFRTIDVLSRRKDHIQKQIDAEMAKRMPCSLTLSRLKKVRLWLKDRIARLQSRISSGRAVGAQA